VSVHVLDLRVLLGDLNTYVTYVLYFSNVGNHHIIMNQVQVSAVSAVGASSFFDSFFFSFFVLEPFGLPTFFWGVSSVSIFPFGCGVSGGPDILNIGQLHATA